MSLQIKPIWSVINNFTEKAGEVLLPHRKLFFVCLGLLGILLVILISIPRIVQHTPKIPADSSRKLESTVAPLSAPEEEFFPADEPNFLPEVLLEQEPRTSWTAEDASPFWRDPMTGDPEIWRRRIEMAIDELLEGVP
jgi:cytoskeletal protein RodZ